MTDQHPERLAGMSSRGKGHLMKEALMRLAESAGRAVLIEESLTCWPYNREGEYEKLVTDGRKPAEVQLGDVTLDPEEPHP